MSKIYITVQGDMWDKIAYEQCGDVAHTDKLIRMNPQHRNIYIFPAGINLIIPSFEAPVKDTKVPPWKKVEG